MDTRETLPAEGWRATFAHDALRIHDDEDAPPVVGLVAIGIVLFWSGFVAAWWL